MMDAHFDLQLLKRHLVSGRSEVIDIGIAQIISFHETTFENTLFNDRLRELKYLILVIVAHNSIKDMVIVTLVIKPNYLIITELCNRPTIRISQNHNIVRLIVHITQQCMVRIHFHIKEQKLSIRVCVLIFFGFPSNLGALELHFVDELKTIIAVVCTTCGKSYNRSLKIFYIIYRTRILSIFEYLIDVVDRGLGS